jgi:ribonucleoside-diphosphate reductase alpha chain
VTISVKEDEWMDVGAWVWRHFDEVSGVSFLPWDGGTYRQAPYEECTEEVYNELLAKMPTNIYWDSLVEKDDNVEGAQTLACVSGHCEI